MRYLGQFPIRGSLKTAILLQLLRPRNLRGSLPDVETTDLLLVRVPIDKLDTQIKFFS